MHIWICTCLIWLVAVYPGVAESFRIAAYNVSLGRKGPGLLLSDLEKGKDEQIIAVQKIIATVSPDILLLSDFDFDLGNVALNLFADQIGNATTPYPYRIALMPNSGRPSGLDLDGDGRPGGPGDAFGYGGFSGSHGMAILSRYPIDMLDMRDFSAILWKDLPGATMPTVGGEPFGGVDVQAARRLSSVGHWDVPVSLPGGNVLHLFASNPTPPVFDGPEDRNGLRNRDEIRFWSLYIDDLGNDVLFVVLGDLNADPIDGEGAHDAVRGLLAHPRIQDPRPSSKGAYEAASRQGGANGQQSGDPHLDTVDWRDTSGGPGNMRVDYVLPSRTLKVHASGVFWPAVGERDHDLVGPDGATGSHHRLVWVDVE
ncbi:MAG: endonuclease/exonuclease/phosphatase family protein [Paracoccaceae bacterium]